MRESFHNMLDRNKKRYEEDKKRFAESDEDLCMMCHAYGDDKRSLLMRCLYAIHEVVPEAIDTFDIDVFKDFNGYYIRICKSCRGRLLEKLSEWRKDCVALRDKPKDHDGYLEEDDHHGMIPVRKNGVIVWVYPSADK